MLPWPDLEDEIDQEYDEDGGGGRGGQDEYDEEVGWLHLTLHGEAFCCSFLLECSSPACN